MRCFFKAFWFECNNLFYPLEQTHLAKTFHLSVVVLELIKRFFPLTFSWICDILVSGTFIEWNRRSCIIHITTYVTLFRQNFVGCILSIGIRHTSHRGDLMFIIIVVDWIASQKWLSPYGRCTTVDKKRFLFFGTWNWTIFKILFYQKGMVYISSDGLFLP